MYKKDALQLHNIGLEEFMPTLDDKSIDLVLTDPPYQISKKTGFLSCGDKGVERFKVPMSYGKWDKKTDNKQKELIDTFCKEAYRVLKPSGTIIVFYDLWKIESLSEILKDKGFRMLRFIEWLKTNPVPLNSSVSYLTNAREVAVVAVKGSKPTFNSKYNRGVFERPIHRDGGKRIHPTQKPLALMSELIEIHSNSGDVVLDPFSGSATTLISAFQNDRSSIGCEISSKFYKSAVKRLTKLFGGSDE